MEFGEDYGNYLGGNQSDWSNQSTTFGFSPSLPRKCIKSTVNVADSEDSESQDIKYLLKEYSDQLVYTGRIYKSQLEIGLSDYLVTKDVSGKRVVRSDTLLHRFYFPFFFLFFLLITERCFGNLQPVY